MDDTWQPSIKALTTLLALAVFLLAAQLFPAAARSVFSILDVRTWTWLDVTQWTWRAYAVLCLATIVSLTGVKAWQNR